MTLGTHQRLTLPRDVERLAVGDESVLGVELLSTREALVLGKATGTTTVLAWYAGGGYEPWLFRVQPDLSLLQSALDDIAAGLTVEMAPDRDALVLRGVVPGEIHRQAVLRAALGYLDASAQLGVTVGSPPAADSSGGVQLDGEASRPRRRNSGRVIDLLRLEQLPGTLEERILAAIAPVAGPDVTVRRVQRSPLSDDTADVLVLEGFVADQISLVRTMQLAARLFLGEEQGNNTNRNSIQVLADEAGSLVNVGGGQNGAGQLGGGGGQLGGGGGGGGGGFAGGGGGGFAGGGLLGVRRNEIQRNLGRAAVLSMARGRILSFVEVRDLPQVRVAVQLFEIDRDQLFQFAAEVTAQASDFDQPALSPSGISSGLQDAPASVGTFTDPDVQAGLASLATGFTQEVQVSAGRLALETLLQALESRGIARRLSSPVLSVLNGETAQFQVGGEIPVLETFTPAAAADAGIGTFASVDFRAFGVGLGIRPLVGREGDVTLDLSSIVSQPDESLTTVVRTSTGTDPATTAFSTRSLQTSARLQDGQSLLVGGLVARQLQRDVSKTPILGDIPLLGWMFRSVNDTYTQSELFVLVSPSVVRPPVPGSDLWVHPTLQENLFGGAQEEGQDSDGSGEPAHGSQSGGQQQKPTDRGN